MPFQEPHGKQENKSAASFSDFVGFANWNEKSINDQISVLKRTTVLSHAKEYLEKMFGNALKKKLGSKSARDGVVRAAVAFTLFKKLEQNGIIASVKGNPSDYLLGGFKLTEKGRTAIKCSKRDKTLKARLLEILRDNNGNGILSKPREKFEKIFGNNYVVALAVAGEIAQNGKSAYFIRKNIPAAPKKGYKYEINHEDIEIFDKIGKELVALREMLTLLAEKNIAGKINKTEFDKERKTLMEKFKKLTTEHENQFYKAYRNIKKEDRL